MISQSHINFIIENYEIFSFNKEAVVIPIQIYLELNNTTNIIKLLNNYDDKLQKKIIEHTHNILKKKKNY